MPGMDLQALRVTAGPSVLVDLTAHIAPGQVLTIMGPSGSGKSTLLAAITGTLTPGLQQSGRVLLDGRDLTALPTRDRRIGILFQDPLLFPHLSVAGNLAFALPQRSPDRARQIETALEEAGLPGFGPRDPATLSGGERARVALMRTLLAAPKALLLDEPFSRLDAALRAQIRSFVLQTARSRGLPTLMVTHDASDASAAGGGVLSPTGAQL
ncbi:MAG: ATP-binding cassette domain-containing protein [Paracoccaceae bacterium]